MHWLLLIALLLILSRWAMELWLERLNQRHVCNHAQSVPEPWTEVIDESTYAKSVDYTLAKCRLGKIESTHQAAILAVVLFSGLLPWAYQWFTGRLGESAWAMAGFLLVVGAFFVVAGLPLGYYSQFGLEERFGFNTSSPRLWWLDQLKGFLLTVILGYPLLVLILKLVEWTGEWWWLWAWVVVVLFQLLMMVLGPVLILPLFNKFSPLPEGSLRDRLLELSRRAGFQASGVQVMDGSKRSRHSNAFFTGFGRFRKIVLFDTLIEQLTEPQLEAVLAHEIGHYKKRHIPKMLGLSLAGLFVAFFILSVLARQEWFFQAFGFETGNIPLALLLFALLSGTVSFWLSPLENLWTRRFEYQADAFAVRTTGEAQPLIAALRRLTEKNLSNLTPHPWYSKFYYSHPTLTERESALKQATT